MNFNIEQKDKRCLARKGHIDLPHGRVHTPAFMPVGTNGAVKAAAHETIEKIGYEIILGNTYHLYLRPGEKLIQKYGDLHTFSTWNGNILTDSGGYQIFSLAPFRKIKDEGVYFRSHIDGSYHTLTPESVVRLQRVLGSDIMMPLDVCTAPGIEYKEALDALKKTTAWAKKSFETWKTLDDAYAGQLFCIIQGNFYKDLRKQSTEELLEIDFPGIAIGGLSVGESTEQFNDFLSYTAGLLPEDKPHYLMGIGTPDYILSAVENGIDLFDCVFPTRIARNGTVFTDGGTISLKKAPFENDMRPIMDNCGCSACTRYSRAYIRHLFKTKEILGPMLATEHNLTYLKMFMDRIHKAIDEGRFTEFKEAYGKGTDNGEG